MGKTYRRNVLNLHNVDLKAAAEYRAKGRRRIIRGEFVRGYSYGPTSQELIDEEYKWLARYCDDRKGYESGQNKAYKNLCKKERRNSDRVNINKAMKAIDEDAYDDLQLDWHTDHHSKHHIWSVW